LLRDLGGDEIDDGLVDLEVPQVDRRDTVLIGEELGDVVFFDEPELDEVEPELPAALLLCFERFLELRLGDHPRLEEHLSELDRHGCPGPPSAWRWRAMPLLD